MTNASDHIVRLGRAPRFVLRHLQIVEGNFETVDELSRAAHHAHDSLEEIRLKEQFANNPEAEFTDPAQREPKAAELTDTTLLVTRTLKTIHDLAF